MTNQQVTIEKKEAECFRRWCVIFCTNLALPKHLAFSQPDVPVVLPVDHAEMRRVSGQYDLIKLVTGNMHFEEINGHLLRETEETVRVLDVVSNSPWLVRIHLSVL